MKTFAWAVVTVVTLISYCPQNTYGLVIPIATTTKAPFPWAEFMKQKFAALPLAIAAQSEDPTTTTTTAKPSAVYPESVLSDFVTQLVAHIKAKVGNQTKVEVTTTVGPPTTTTEEPTENNYEDALLREVYLDWGKRQTRQIEEPEAVEEQPAELEFLSAPLPPPTSAPVTIPTAQVANPIYASVPLTYGYPYPPPFPIGLYGSLAAFKIQKGVVQAQIDAALAAMNITTTPKPTKVKLKFMLPAGSSLPAGLENFVVS